MGRISKADWRKLEKFRMKTLTNEQLFQEFVDFGQKSYYDMDDREDITYTVVYKELLRRLKRWLEE